MPILVADDIDLGGARVKGSGSPVDPGDLVSLSSLRSVTTLTSDASLVATAGALRNDLYVTALAVNATLGVPSGTPANGNVVRIRINDDGAARTLAWNAIWRPWSVTLPTTTTAGKGMRIAAEYNSRDSKWDVLAVSWED